jgi:hypothetical protein
MYPAACTKRAIRRELDTNFEDDPDCDHEDDYEEPSYTHELNPLRNVMHSRRAEIRVIEALKPRLPISTLSATTPATNTVATSAK